MLLERIYDNDLAQASYLIGCQAQGEAIVVDPRRDITVYLELASQHGMRIVGVTETHIHADYLSGTRELAQQTGATVYVSDEGGPDWTYGPLFDDAVRMKDGHEILLGNIVIEASHTPGHTPEHMAFLVTDGAQASEPGFYLSGDFVFVGDLGRPDLLDAAAGGIDTRFQGARDLFASLRDRFLTLPDYVQVYPAHGAGSACGKALGAIPSTTVGYEREFSWWAKYLNDDDEQGFVDELLSGQPDAHAYFARMKVENRRGPALLGPLSSLAEHDAKSLAETLDSDSAIFIDTRRHTEIAQGTVLGALIIPGIAKAASYGAWVYDPETETRPLIVLATSAAEAQEFRDHLIRVGIDTLTGYATSLDGLTLTPPQQVAPDQLDTVDGALLLDVRTRNEYEEGHIPGADQLAGGRVLWHLDELPTAGTIVTYCQSGVRNTVISSALRRAGYDVVQIEGSYAAWAASQDAREPGLVG
ncbi:MAG: MBL fold metallo-hydrolase [Gulosibacter sp.]|uniref:MBL fold metallo-hydrolase n=1 Tax=Gulosibacter sp. TaxID=2817531 RepID=UPI003F91D63C